MDFAEDSAEDEDEELLSAFELALDLASSLVSETEVSVFLLSFTAETVSLPLALVVSCAAVTASVPFVAVTSAQLLVITAEN